MRLRVEVEWKGEPWRKLAKVQKLAVVDALFGIAIAILYVVKLSWPDLEPELPGLTSAERLNNSLALVFLTAANLIQAIHAGRFLFVISKEDRNPTSCFQVAKTWYDFSEFGYLFIVVKFVITLSYIIRVAPHPWLLILVGLTAPEIVFKMGALFVVYGFMKDLKQSLKYMPKFRFIPVSEEEGCTFDVVGPDYFNNVENHDHSNYYHKFFEVDMNANTKLLE